MLNLMFLLMALNVLLALRLRSLTALWKLPVALMFRQRYSMYSFVCALGQRCLDGSCICGPSNWTFFGTPLFLSYWDSLSQNLCRRSKSYLVEDRSTRSSANSRHLTSDSSRVRPVLQNVLVPLPIRWYVCWRGWGLSCIPVSAHVCVERNVCFFAHFNHTLVVCVHEFHNTFPSICITDPHAKLSLKLFWNQQSMRRLHLFWFVCLSMQGEYVVCRAVIWYKANLAFARVWICRGVFPRLLLTDIPR